MFEWVRPRAGSVGFPRLRLATPVEQFAHELVGEAGVLVLPGTVHDYPGEHFRIGFGREAMPEALARLEEFAFKGWRAWRAQPNPPTYSRSASMCSS